MLGYTLHAICQVFLVLYHSMLFVTCYILHEVPVRWYQKKEKQAEKLLGPGSGGRVCMAVSTNGGSFFGVPL